MNAQNFPYVGELPPKSLADNLIDLATGLLRWRETIEDALMVANYSHTFDDIVRIVVTGGAQFFEYDDCFIIMQVDVFPQHKAYHCFLAGGHMPSIMEKQEQMRANAKALGCKYMTITGRHGWVRQLKNAGWTHQYSILHCEV